VIPRIEFSLRPSAEILLAVAAAVEEPPPELPHAARNEPPATPSPVPAAVRSSFLRVKGLPRSAPSSWALMSLSSLPVA
jgi:hypothetical protein